MAEICWVLAGGVGCGIWSSKRSWHVWAGPTKVIHSVMVVCFILYCTLHMSMWDLKLFLSWDLDWTFLVSAVGYWLILFLVSTVGSWLKLLLVSAMGSWLKLFSVSGEDLGDISVGVSCVNLSEVMLVFYCDFTIYNPKYIIDIESFTLLGFRNIWL